MSRRSKKSSKFNVLPVVGVAVAVVFAVAVSTLTQQKSPYSQLSHLPVLDLMENGNSFRGNRYQVQGKIEERWVKNEYEGVHLSVEEKGQKHPVFIKIPIRLERPNMERGNHYVFSVEIEKGGVPLATGIQRL